VVDDTLFLDMLQDGFKPSLYDIYFFKLDVDPDVMEHLAGTEADKWKSIQWVIETPYMWQNANCGPEVNISDTCSTYTTVQLLRHSKVVWYYGRYAPNSVKGQNSDVEIREVTP